MQTKLAKVLRDFMASQGIRSARELAQKFDNEVSHGYLSNLLAGENPATGKTIDPKIGTLKLLAKKMGMPIERLLYLSGYTDEESVKIKPEEFDDEYRKIFAEHGIDYLVVTKKAYENGITPDMLQNLIEVIKSTR